MRGALICIMMVFNAGMCIAAINDHVPEFAFSDMPMGVRPMALAGAYTGVIGLESVSWNPGALGNTLAFAFVDAPRVPAAPAEPRLPWLAGIAALRLPLPAGLPAPLHDAAVPAEIPSE